MRVRFARDSESVPAAMPPACRLFDGDPRRDGQPDAFSMSGAAVTPGDTGSRQAASPETKNPGLGRGFI